MTHPDVGLIRAFLDGELDEGEAEALRSHAGSCEECQAEIRIQEEGLDGVSAALLLLDNEPPLAEARSRIQALRVNGARPNVAPIPVIGSGDRSKRKKASYWGASGSLLKAAAIAFLLIGGAASALPGSPVRGWLAHWWQAISGGEPAMEEGLVPGEGNPMGMEAPSPPEIWAGVTPEEGGVELGLFDVPEDAEIRVVWIQGDNVRVYAGVGTRFRTESDRVEAHSPPGGVRVEIPSSLSRVLLTLDGRTLLRKAGTEVELLDSAQTQTPREIVFGSGSVPNEG